VNEREREWGRGIRRQQIKNTSRGREKK